METLQKIEIGPKDSQINRSTHVLKQNTDLGERDLVKMYFKDLPTYKALTREEEINYIRRIQKGDRKAESQFISHYLRFVVKVARGYVSYKVSLCDLINEGNLGLIRAIRTFDVKKGNRFISYAVWWIKQSLLCYIWKNAYVVHLPRNRIEALKQEETDALYHTQKGFNRKRLGRYERGLLSHATLSASSLSRSIQQEGSSPMTLEDLLADSQDLLPSKIVLREELKKEVEYFLSQIPKKESDIVKMRFGWDNTKVQSLAKIGEGYGVTKERIRQLEGQALRRLATHRERARLATFM